MARSLSAVLLATVVLILGACSSAAGPPTTPAPVAQAATAPATTAPASATAAPAPAATPTAAPTAAPTVAPTKPAVAASPTTAPRTPTAAAPTPTASATQQTSSGVTDCDTDLGCFIEASRTGHLAKVDYTMAVNFFGLFLSNTDTLAIEGKDGDRLLFSQKTIQAVAGLTDAIYEAAVAQGMSGADIEKAITTAKGVAELVELGDKDLDDSAKQELSKSRETQQARVGTGKQCKFLQPALTAMLEQWQRGQYSSSDWDPGQCTDITAASATGATPAPSGPGGVSPRGLKLLDASALPAELKSVPLPPGFGVEEGNVDRWAEGGVFRSADARLFGKMNVKDLSAFYKNQLAAEWNLDSAAVGGGSGAGFLEANYINRKDPNLILYILAEETAEGTTVDLRLESTPTAAGTPTAAADPVPAELRGVPIPSGFTFITGSAVLDLQRGALVGSICWDA